MFGKWPALKPESDKFLHFDALRIIGATLVACNHWSSSMTFAPAVQPYIDNMDNFTVLVDKFFLLSGFIICHLYAERIGGWPDFLSFLKKRIARVAPLHWATLFFFGAIGVGAALLNYRLANPENYDFQCFAPSLLFLNAAGVCDSLDFNYPSWSIGAEMACYLLLPLYLLLYRVNVWLPGALALAMIAVMQLIGPIGPDHHLWLNLTYDGGVLRAIPAFGVGVTLYGVRDKLKYIPFAGQLTYALYALVVIGAVLNWNLLLLMTMVYAMAICGAAADANSQRAGLLTRTLAPFGTISYSVYMLHVPLGVLLFTLGYEKILHLPQEAINVLIPLSFPILFVVGYVSLFWFETPARRWVNGLGKKRVAMTQAA